MTTPLTSRLSISLNGMSISSQSIVYVGPDKLRYGKEENRRQRVYPITLLNFGYIRGLPTFLFWKLSKIS